MADATYGNPLDLEYRVQDAYLGPKRYVFREGADPSAVRFGDRIYLFPSMAGGFWHTSDLVDWEFVATPEIPFGEYAPDVTVVDGHLVVCTSRKKGACDFYRTADPLSARWEVVPGSFVFWDPALFQDDDGRVYLYEGCSDKAPLRGRELDRVTFQPVGEWVDFFTADTAAHGWERCAEDWDMSRKRTGMDRVLTKPWIEGVWMTKHEGRYYLQYAAPASHMNTYSDGYRVGAGPLGPFRYAEASPFSSKPGGFMTGAGHGSTFADAAGNWWHLATMRISRQHLFERRIGLFPAGFDADGILFTNQEFGDYPIVAPTGKADPWALTGTMMLQSLGRPVTSSSSARGHDAALAVDEDVRTWWKAGSAEPGEWLCVELAPGTTVAAVQVNTIEEGARPPRSPRSERRGTPYPRTLRTDAPVDLVLEASVDGVVWQELVGRSAAETGRPHRYVQLDEPAPYRYVRVTGHRQAYGLPLAVSGLRVFGHGGGEPPAASDVVTATRVGPLDADVRWTPSPTAHGYTVRYGLAPDKLYHSWQVHEATSLRIGSLNAGSTYVVAVDAFNENGVTRGAPVVVG